jgi:hypothetical protein
MRMVRDNHGKSWRVWHVVPQSQVLKSASPAMAGGWLCFDNDGDKRRLAGPPTDWEQLSDEELLGLLGRATAVKKMAV